MTLLPPNAKALILDMDGVLWRSEQPIGNLPEIFACIHERGLDFMLATNNATRTPAQYVQKLAGFGVQVEEAQIINSAMTVAYLVAQRFPQGGLVYVVGENGVRQALKERGFEAVDEFTLANPPLAVVAGLDRKITYEKLRIATLLIRNNNVPYYATNPDRTFPTPEGLVPGAGAILASLNASTDQEPILAGKPQPAMMELALERLDTSAADTLVVGDRLETDIAGGQAVGCPTALVLSGVSSRAAAEKWSPPVDIIADDLATLIGV